MPFSCHGLLSWITFNGHCKDKWTYKASLHLKGPVLNSERTSASEKIKVPWKTANSGFFSELRLLQCTGQITNRQSLAFSERSQLSRAILQFSWNECCTNERQSRKSNRNTTNAGPYEDRLLWFGGDMIANEHLSSQESPAIKKQIQPQCFKRSSWAYSDKVLMQCWVWIDRLHSKMAGHKPCKC